MGAEFKMPSAADNPKISKDQKLHSHAGWVRIQICLVSCQKFHLR